MRPGATRAVHIFDECDVDYEVVNVWKPKDGQAGDQIEWHSTGPAFTIDFDSSPFKSDHFEVPAGGCTSSGPVRDDAIYARYHYTIRSKANLAMSADPDVDVRK